MARRVVNFRLAEGMAWHFACMWLFAVNGVCYVLYTLFSGEWRFLVPGRASFREAWQVLLHDLHLSRRRWMVVRCDCSGGTRSVPGPARWWPPPRTGA